MERAPQIDNLQSQISTLSEKLRKRSWKIGIDGPAAVGKGTLANLLAEKLNLNKIETGRMYRAITCWVRDNAIDLNVTDDEQLNRLLQNLIIRFQDMMDGSKNVIVLKLTPDQNEPKEFDVTQKLDDPEISSMVSAVAARIPVRDKVDKQAMTLLRAGRAIIEGRDMWQIAKPYTDVLIYLCADDEILVKREMKRQRERGREMSEEKVREIVIRRNQQDNQRNRGQLLTPHQAQEKGGYDVIINTSHLSPQEVLLKALQTMDRKMGGE